MHGTRKLVLERNTCYDNIFRDNVAAGSDGTGFWFSLPQPVAGATAALFPEIAASINPASALLGEFKNNVAHSNAGAGVFQDNCVRPDGTVAGCYWGARQTLNDKLGLANAGDSQVSLVFENVTAYKNRSTGIWYRAFQVNTIGAKLADNATGYIAACVICEQCGLLIVGTSANKGNLALGEATAPDGRTLFDPAHPAVRRCEDAPRVSSAPYSAYWNQGQAVLSGK